MALVPLLDLRAVQPAPDIVHAPCNIEAEQALLGVLLYDNSAYERLSDHLQARHFFEPFHGRLYDAVQSHIRRGQLAEPILMAEQFQRDPAFEELGAVRYLADLVDRAPPAAHAADYARVIYDLALRRDLIRIGGDVAADADQVAAQGEVVDDPGVVGGVGGRRGAVHQIRQIAHRAKFLESRIALEL